MIDPAEAPGAGSVKLALPRLSGVDRARREQAAHLLKSNGLRAHNVVRGAVRLELFDEAQKAWPILALRTYPTGALSEV